MASTSVSQQCPKHEYLGGGRHRYLARREALIAAGVAKAEWFPDGDKAWTASRTVRMQAGAKVVLRQNPSGTFVVEVWPARSEREAAFEREHIAFDKERAAERERLASSEQRAASQRAIEQMPQDATAFAKRLEAMWVPMLRSLFDFTYEGHGGYRLAPEAIKELGEGTLALIRVLRDARVVFDGARRADEEQSLRARALPAMDCAFEHFMAKTLNSGGQLRQE